MGNAVVKDNYQISLNYTSPPRDGSPSVIELQRKKNAPARFHRQAPYFLFTLNHSVPFPCTSNTENIMRLLLRLPSPQFQSAEWSVSYFWQRDWMWEVRWVTVCSHRALVISRPRWQESCQVSPQTPCVCVCLQNSVAMTTTSWLRDLGVCVWAWVLWPCLNICIFVLWCV